MAQFVLGRIAYDSDPSKLDEARTHLRRAIDDDVCPLRATQAIEQIVRQQQRRDKIILIDTPRRFDQRNAKGQRDSDGVPDPEWFVDHVHPTISGHQVIAKAIYLQLVEHNWFQPSLEAISDSNRLRHNIYRHSARSTLVVPHSALTA